MYTDHPKTALLLAFGIAWSACVQACASDGADEATSTPEDEQSPGATHDEGAQTGSFGELVSSNVQGRYQHPANVDDAAERSEAIVVGEVVDLVAGRRKQIDDGRDPENYTQYYDIVIRPTEVLKAEISTSADVHIEFVWPRNLPTDRLSSTLPRGARALVFGTPNATEGTSHTLMRVPPYGLVFENSDGTTTVPFESDLPFEAIVSGAPSSFAELLAAIGAS